MGVYGNIKMDFWLVIVPVVLRICGLYYEYINLVCSSDYSFPEHDGEIETLRTLGYNRPTLCPDYHYSFVYYSGIVIIIA
jgi:hypothetical protein